MPNDIPWLIRLSNELSRHGITIGARIRDTIGKLFEGDDVCVEPGSWTADDGTQMMRVVVTTSPPLRYGESQRRFHVCDPVTRKVIKLEFVWVARERDPYAGSEAFMAGMERVQ